MKRNTSKIISSADKSFININSYLTISLLLIVLTANILTACQIEQNGKTGRKSYVLFEKTTNSFVLSENGNSAPIFFDTNDYKGVQRVVSDLQSDISKVTAAKPVASPELTSAAKEVIIIGTIGKNKFIDKLIEDKKIDAGRIRGKWEAYLINVVANPFPGVDKALVLAGSDKRGTIYAAYDLSENIGVSPWYWWADVPVKKHDKIYIAEEGFLSTGPKVKYRGIFLNDEAPALVGWTREKFGGLNHKFYVNVFELILRLKGNFLWPAMWDNNFDDDDPLNQKLADEYGVVMGTSHHEPMMRSWKEWPKYGKGKWNYAVNDSVLREYWREGINRMNSYESIVTLAMRGDGDEAMGETANIGLLEKVVTDQRKILHEVTGKNVAEIPQVWALYKEVQEYYDKGMTVPDDVTLLLCDDNWGNLRKLPKPAAKPRKGGYGIYYHFDYVGGPRNYKWLNTVQIERVWEQMHLAYEYGAKQIWIVNVGDLKPMEFPINFFLNYAWDPENITAEDLPAYYKNWAAEQFGEKYSGETAEIISSYTRFNSRRKPELLSPETYSFINYGEAERVVSDYNSLYEKARDISSKLPDEYKDSFYQLVLHPVEACSNLNEMLVAIGKNRQYAEQGRISANDYALKAQKLFERDADITNYYNNVLSGGKWNHMMDQTHIGYTYWQQPDQNNLPEVKKIDIPAEAEMGVAVEGSEKWWPESKEISLPEFDSFGKQSYYIEIYNRGKNQFDFTITTDAPWIKISIAKGSIQKQTRLYISVDWEKIPSAKNYATIKIEGTGKTVFIKAVANNFNNPAVKGPVFVESSGYISIEAAHYSSMSPAGNVSWITVPGLGRTFSAVTTIPVVCNSFDGDGKRPQLEYNVFLNSAGKVKVNLYFSPTLNFNQRPEGIRYAVSFDDGKPATINITNNPDYPDLNRDPVWNKWVSDNINLSTSVHEISGSGNHVLKIGMVDPGLVLQKIVIDSGGERKSYLGPPESNIVE